MGHGRSLKDRSLLPRKVVRTVGSNEFVHTDQASAELGLRTGWINLLANKGDLERCTTTTSGPMSATDIGVTRESLDRQLAWWSEADAAARFKRKVRLVIAGGAI